MREKLKEIKVYTYIPICIYERVEADDKEKKNYDYYFYYII